MAFRISVSETNKLEIIAWHPKNEKRYLVSNINFQSIKNKPSKLFFEAIWPTNNWKSSWEFYPVIESEKINKMFGRNYSDRHDRKTITTRLVGPASTVHKCPNCEKVCKNKGGLASHLKACTKTKERVLPAKTETENIESTCPKCFKIYSNKHNLVSHVKNCTVNLLRMSWPEFTHEHKSLSKDEISKLWMEYKQGYYNVEKSELSVELKKNVNFLLGHGTSIKDVSSSQKLPTKTVKNLAAELKDKSLALLRGGVKRSQISRLLGVHPQILKKWQKSAKISGKGYGKKKELKEFVIELTVEGRSKKDIADSLGLTQSTIRKWLNEEGIIDPAKIAEVELQKESQALIIQGYSVKEVVKILGISESKIRNWKNFSDFPVRESVSKYSTEQENDVIDLLRESKSIAEISRITGVSKYKIKKWKIDAERTGFL